MPYLSLTPSPNLDTFKELGARWFKKNSQNLAKMTLRHKISNRPIRRKKNWTFFFLSRNLKLWVSLTTSHYKLDWRKLMKQVDLVVDAFFLHSHQFYSNAVFLEFWVTKKKFRSNNLSTYRFPSLFAVDTFSWFCNPNSDKKRSIMDCKYVKPHFKKPANFEGQA